MLGERASNEASKSGVVKNLLDLFRQVDKSTYDLYDKDKILQCCVWGHFVVFFIFYTWGWQELFKYSKKNDSWNCLFHWLLVSFMNFLFIIPNEHSVLSHLVGPENMIGWPIHCMRYFRTLYAYVLVWVALYSYNLVFKTFKTFTTPLSRLQWCMVLAGLYIISSFPTLYCMYVYGWAEKYEKDEVYYMFTWMFSRNPEPRHMIILIIWNHIIPAGLIRFFLEMVKIELTSRNELELFEKRKNYSLCLGDRKCVRLLLCVCSYYSFSSVALIYRETVRFIFSFDPIPDYMTLLIEVFPFFMMALESSIFVLYEFSEDKEFGSVWDDGNVGEKKGDWRKNRKNLKQR
ncbi:uncharacterized protein TNCV_4515011 [Trichonephila clavipes]|nr:uncharacterized protein TNCV_4515011 [Trichonephila clavipes]